MLLRIFYRTAPHGHMCTRKMESAVRKAHVMNFFVSRRGALRSSLPSPRLQGKLITRPTAALLVNETGQGCSRRSFSPENCRNDL